MKEINQGENSYEIKNQISFGVSFGFGVFFVIPGIVKAYAYSMSFFILKDNKDMQAKECLEASEKLMVGHKQQLFALDLSFLGWYFVGALCLGVGILFVIPYHYMARANFYEALKAGV